MSTIRLNDGKGFVCAAALAAVLVLLAGGVNALATTNTVWCVPNTSISATCTPGAGKGHIQDAITGTPHAKAGDVILVGPGHYYETVEVSFSNISILGAQAGNDARVGRYDTSKESVVDASASGSPYGTGEGAAFDVHVPGVVIDGFTIVGGTSGASNHLASGIFANNSSIQILDNIIQNNAIGVFLANSSYALVEYNLFKTNNTPTSGSNLGSGFDKVQGYGIVGTGGFYYGSITENAFEGNSAAAIYFDYSWYDEVTKDTSEKDGSFLACYYCQYDFIDHNQGRDFCPTLPIAFTSPSGPADAAIDLLYQNNYLQINDNDLEKGKAADYNGIAFSTIAGASESCVNCQVTNNTISGFAGNGIVAEPAGSNATLSASWILRNDVEDNVLDGIVIGTGSGNAGNMVLDNKAEGNHVNDCEDDTVGTGTLTLTTKNTWYNDIGPYSYPTGLCMSRGRGH
jgi:hypothetical protein